MAFVFVFPDFFHPLLTAPDPDLPPCSTLCREAQAPTDPLPHWVSPWRSIEAGF